MHSLCHNITESALKERFTSQYKHARLQRLLCIYGEKKDFGLQQNTCDGFKKTKFTVKLK